MMLGLFDGVKYRVMQSVPQNERLLALRYLEAAADDEFRQFSRYYQALVANQNPPHPTDMPNLVPVLGFAFWYLGAAVRENKCSDTTYDCSLATLWECDKVNLKRSVERIE
jgi:hypothetical protein